MDIRRDGTMPSQLAVSPLMRSASRYFCLLSLLWCFIGIAGAENPCLESQYLDADGSCASCNPHATTDDSFYNGAAACVCIDNYYLDEPSGSCLQCPSRTNSERGANLDLSGCVCQNNWVGTGGFCEACGAGGHSVRPNNKNASDCVCSSNWYGPPGTLGGCTACPKDARSVMGDNSDFSGCECRRGYWGLGGNTDNCTKCGPNSDAAQGSNSDISDCLCKAQWYGRNGVCHPCPSDSRSSVGSNFEASDCKCRANWYMTESGCEKCPANSYSVEGENWNRSSCQCRDNYYGDLAVENAECEQCPNNHWSEKGSNAAVEDCKCRSDWYGPGGGNCMRCPGLSSSSYLSNANDNPSVSCTSCDARYYGTPTLKGGAGSTLVYDTGCTRCPDNDLTTVQGSNDGEEDCYCPANNKLYESFDDDDVCTTCPNRTSLAASDRPGPGQSISSCVCPNRDWYGPVVWDADSRDCFRCEPYSKIPIDKVDATSKDDCVCNADSYGLPGETCTKCPAYTAVPWSDPAYYVSKSPVGSVTETDCVCPQDFYGPVVRPDPRPHPPAWINEFHYDNEGVDENEFIEIVTLDGENSAGFTLQLYNGVTRREYGKTYKILPQPSGFGYTFTVTDWPGESNKIENGETAVEGIALINDDNGEVVEFICYDRNTSDTSATTFTAQDGPAQGETCVYIGTDAMQNSDTPVGASIQRTGGGSWIPVDFTWESMDRHTKGRANRGQLIRPPSGVECRRCPADAPFSVRGSNAVEGDCLCKNNWYKDAPVSGECKQCPQNSVSYAPNNVGIESCLCRDDWYLDTTSGECTRCPNSGQTVRGENLGLESCSCQANWYGANTSVCQKCPGNGKSNIQDNWDLSKCSCPSDDYGLNAEAGCNDCPANTKTIAYGPGINVLSNSCSCEAGEYGPGYGDCTQCPNGTMSKPGYNFEVGACACPDDFYGPGFGDCTPCPQGGSSVSTKNKGVFSCQCPVGFAMAYMHYVGGVKQAPSCVESAVCDGILDKISGKCWKLFSDDKMAWDVAEQTCLDWTTPVVPDAFLEDPDYFPTPGHLASIITREDLTLSRIIFDDYGFERDDEFWIGANDIDEEGTWTWSDGSTYAFVQELWGPNEPNDSGGGEDCGSLWKRWYGYGTNTLTPLFNDYRCTNKFPGLCSKSPNNCISGNNECSPNAECIDRDFGTGYFGYTCQCHFGFLDVLGNGTVCEPANVQNCDEDPSNECHELAYCHVYHLQPDLRICSCPEGMIGDGIGPNGCVKNSWTVRAVVKLPDIMPNVDITGNNKLSNWPYCKESIARLFFDSDDTRPSWFVDAMHHHITGDNENGYVMTLNGLFPSESDAKDGLAAFNSWADKGVYACTTKIQATGERRILGDNDRSIVLVSPDTVLDGTPGVYTWVAGTTGDPLQLKPTGFEIESVYFNPSCMATGCWVVDIIYTRGRDNFVSFYLPHALRPNGNDIDPLLPGMADLSVDYDYNVIPASDTAAADNVDYWYWDWRKSPETTFFPANFPCGSNDYDPATSPEGNPPMKMTACCIPEFRETYRPVKAFYDATADVAPACRAPEDSLLTEPGRPWNIADPANPGGTFKVYQRDGPLPVDGLGASGDGGLFAGLTWSRIDPTGVVDPYIGQYRARVQLDEKELREMAGKLSGTVGVEHTVDTFIGLAEFKPTGTGVLDSFNTQTNIHLEKTDFFSVSTHGVNAYTFLEYVNMRLVAVYDEDTDPTETVAENGERTSRTDWSEAAHYVQVTFTLGPQYQPIETGLIPLDSVRVGQGTFMANAFTDKTQSTSGLFHACQQYANGSLPDQNILDTRVEQSCGPNSEMCVNPNEIPDQFVVFNIPLGIDWLPSASSSLSANVFVDLVVSAIDTVAQASMGSPNNGDAPWQMKTTLTASIPVVAGGINIFCDGITAKTDLVDVVQVDLILGSAASDDELSRLRIFEDIANSDLTPKAASVFETDSIEAGLMTLVIKGDSSYFDQSGTDAFRVNVEDVITIHIMEPATAKYDEVKALLETAGDDNSLSTGIDTDGYLLNGAFSFIVDRQLQRAYLEPSDGLLDICAFNPPRPTSNVPFPTTCVIRRDIRRQTYPNRNGAFSTAVEVPQMSETDRHFNSVFFTTFLGDNDYAYNLGATFSQVVADKYELNGRYLRAFMINPGYEWTPTQTGGQSIFTISQRLFLFALVNLDEAFFSAVTPSYTLPTTRANPNTVTSGGGGGGRRRRRMLLSTTANTGAGATAAELSFNTSPKQLLSSALGLTQDRVSVVGVTVGISLADACKAPADLNDHLTQTMQDLFSQVSSELQQVIVMSNRLDFAGQSCPSNADRRSLRLRRSSTVSAATEVLVAFPPGKNSYLDLDKLGSLPDVLGVSKIDVSPKVSIGEVPAEAIPSKDSKKTDSDDKKEDGGSDNTAIIAGAVGGAGGLLLLGAGVMLYIRNRRAQEVEVVHAVNINDLKSTLAEDA